MFSSSCALAVCDLTCHNGGTPDAGSCNQCSCPVGYTGTLCGTDIDECAISGSCLFGTCTNTDGSYMCQCMEGYTGGRCEENIDDCAENSCLNGGTCVDEVAGYSCSCPQHLTGQDCETCQIENCQSCDLSSSPARCAQCENGYTLNTAGLCGMFN